MCKVFLEIRGSGMNFSFTQFDLYENNNWSKTEHVKLLLLEKFLFVWFFALYLSLIQSRLSLSLFSSSCSG